MFKKIIIEKIKNLTLKDVQSFAYQNQVSLNKDEAEIILEYIKKDYEILLYGDPKEIFKNLSQEIGVEKSKKIEDLFFYFKKKYQFYL